MDRTAMGILWSTWGDSPQPAHAQTHRVNSVRRRGGDEAFSPNGVHRGGLLLLPAKFARSYIARARDYRSRIY